MTESPLLLSIQEDAALQYANDVIAKFGGTMQSEMLPGGTGSDDCPISMTIKAGLPDAAEVQVRPDAADVMVLPNAFSAPVTLPMPRDVAEFAIDADAGAYPNLRAAA